MGKVDIDEIKVDIENVLFQNGSGFRQNLLNAGIIEPVAGQGKGKYKSGIDGLGVVDLRHLK